MSLAKPSLLFVPGAWHDLSCFMPTTSILEKEGYTCDLIALPSIGSERRGDQPPQDWNADVEEIRQRVMKHLDNGTDVVLVLHSYGGTVGSEAMKGLGRKDRESAGMKTAVLRMVYLSALVLDVDDWIWRATGNKPIDPTRTILKVPFTTSFICSCGSGS